MNNFTNQFVGVLTLVSAQFCVAQILPNPDYSGGIGERSTLTGDWGGKRGEWASKGLHIDLDTVVTYQNLLDGGFDDEDDVLGSTTLTLQFDTGKAGLWPGGLLKVRTEARYGNSIQPAVGSISPVNTDVLPPLEPGRLGDDVWALTELIFMQFLSEKIGLVAGLINTEEGDSNELAGSIHDNSRFFNTGFRLSLTEGTVAPTVTLGVGVILIPTPKILGQVLAFDTEESAGKDAFDTRNGTSIATEWRYSSEWSGKAGSHVLGFIYGFDQDFSEFDLDPGAVFRSLFPGQTLPTEDEAWALYYNGHQYLHAQDGRQWGVFVRASVSDGDANPVDWTMAAGFGGTGLLRTRPKDTWGIGVYHLELVKGALFQLLDVNDETGFEVFYNFEVTPWLHVTADLQVIDTAVGLPSAPVLPIIGPGGVLPIVTGSGSISESETAVVFGLRTHINF